MFLIDTSAWVLTFDRKVTVQLPRMFSPDTMCIAPPIYQEVLQGIRGETDYFFAKRALDDATMLENPMKLDLFEESAQVFRFLRKKGVTVRSGVDVLLAVCAMRNRATVVHRDRDYPAIAKLTGLQEKSI